jgi:glycosyltransferase involved in cell wall biosynthesis
VTDAGVDLTVVVPAFNVGRYIADCLDSITEQGAWQRSQVLVVDDGSTDDTAAVVAAYAAEHPRVLLVQRSNGGPGAGAARNTGFDLVDTEYVMFLDGDDELAPGGLGTLVAVLDEHGLDIAVGATEQFPVNREWVWSQYFEAGTTRGVRIEDVPLLAHDSRTCDKLYRTAFLRASGVRFAEGVHAQDVVVNVPAMLQAPELMLVGDVVYRYRKREDGTSVMDSQFTRIANYFDHLFVSEQLAALRPDVPAERRHFIDAFIARSFQEYCWRAPEILPASELPRFFARARDLIRTLDPEVVQRATRDAWERAAYVAMLEDDFDTYARLGDHTGRLRTDGHDLYLDLPTSGEVTQGMIRAGATRAWADRVSLGSDVLSFRLRLRIRGARHLDRALAEVAVRGIHEGRTSFEQVVQVTPVDEFGREHEATVRLPTKGLAGGDHTMRIVFRTGDGHVERWVRRPDGADAVPDESARKGLLTVGLSTKGDRALLRVSRPAWLPGR